jgi:heparosan-N-sulfate-glucuronate 5-epimerase
MKRGKKIASITLVVFMIITVFIFLLLFREIFGTPEPFTISEGILKEISFQKSAPQHYYIDFSKMKYLDVNSHSMVSFDSEGIPKYYINSKGHYLPVYICQYALGAFEHYLNTGDKKARAIFLQCASWLKDNLRQHNGFFYWEYNYENEFYESEYPGALDKVPWFSAMAQGEGVSVLIRAYLETGQDNYLLAAEKAVEPLFHDLLDGGVSVVKNDSYFFPQEIRTNPPSDVLNGAIFAYFGVYDYYRITHKPREKKFCDLFTKTVMSIINEYDAGYWSFYARNPKSLVPPSYHTLHIAQLKILYLITGEKKFLEYSKRFEQYQKSWFCRTKYVFANHWRQAKELSWGDIKKVPRFIKKMIFLGEN